MSFVKKNNKKNGKSFDRDEFFYLILQIEDKRNFIEWLNIIYVFAIFLLGFLFLMVFIGGYAFIAISIIIIISGVLWKKNLNYKKSEDDKFLSEHSQIFNSFKKYMFKEKIDQQKDFEAICSSWYKKINFLYDGSSNIRALILLIFILWVILLYVLFLINPLLKGTFQQMVDWSSIKLDDPGTWSSIEINEDLLLFFTSSFFILSFIPVPLFYLIERYEIYKSRFKKMIYKLIVEKEDELYKNYNEMIKLYQSDTNVDLFKRDVRKQLISLINLVNFNIFEDVSRIKGDLINFYKKSELMNFLRIIKKYNILILNILNNKEDQEINVEFNDLFSLIDKISRLIEFQFYYRAEIFEKSESRRERSSFKKRGIIALILTIISLILSIFFNIISLIF